MRVFSLTSAATACGGALAALVLVGERELVDRTPGRRRAVAAEDKKNDSLHA